MQDVQSGAYSIFNQSSDGIILLSKDGQVIFINDKAKFLFNAGDKPLAQEYCDQLLQEHTGAFVLKTIDAEGNLTGVNASVVSACASSSSIPLSCETASCVNGSL